MNIWRKRIADSVNQSVSDEAVCRTAPATRDLLITRLFVEQPGYTGSVEYIRGAFYFAAYSDLYQITTE